jgi:hypothetical protein
VRWEGPEGEERGKETKGGGVERKGEKKKGGVDEEGTRKDYAINHRKKAGPLTYWPDTTLACAALKTYDYGY